MNYLLLHDKETGGLDPKTSDVLTGYYAIVNEDLQIVDDLNLKLKPDGRLPNAEAGALKHNKINLAEHLADPATITYSAAIPQIEALIRKYLKKNGRYSNIRPFGYNIDFDLSFEWQHLIQKAHWDTMIHYVSVDPKRNMDFLKDAGWFPKDLGSLVSVNDYLGLPKRLAHNAKEDCLMTLDVHKVMLQIMREKKDAQGSGGGNSGQDLIALLEAE